jgi:hypothetical protein
MSGIYLVQKVFDFRTSLIEARSLEQGSTVQFADHYGALQWFSCIVISTKSNRTKVRSWWLTPIIVATQEAEIRRIAVRSQPWANSSRRPYLENNQPQKQDWLKRKSTCLAQERLWAPFPALQKNQKQTDKQKTIR